MALHPTRRSLIAGAFLAQPKLWGAPSDRVRLAVIGVGGRGNDHINMAMALPNVEVAALVDPDGNRTEAAAAKILKQTGRQPRIESDMRRILDDKNIDAVTIATCNHWHALSAIWACQAGKDVYVEKPVSHNVFEGGQIVAASRKYNRIVQGGTQRRSMGRFRKAIEIIHGGGIGDIYQAKWTFIGARESIGFKEPKPVPGWLNFDLWVGPAPMQPYHENLVHYNWHWFWDFGNGELGNNGIHLIDVARWGMKKELPVKVSSSGGRFGYKDQAQTPNTQSLTYTYDDGSILIGEIRGLSTNEKFSWDFWGTKGHMHIFSDGKFEVLLGRNKQIEPAADPLPEINHMGNFTEAIRARNRDLLTAEIRETYLSTALCHLGNIAYRMGHELNFDPARGRFLADNTANSLLTREYRKPYVVPDQV